MKEKVTAAWNTFKLFCVSQAWNFYVGLTISALVFLSLFSYLPIGTSACFVPVVTPVIYSGLRYVSGGTFEMKGEHGLRNSLLAVLLSSLYFMILVFI